MYVLSWSLHLVAPARYPSALVYSTSHALKATYVVRSYHESCTIFHKNSFFTTTHMRECCCGICSSARCSLILPATLSIYTSTSCARSLALISSPRAPSTPSTPVLLPPPLHRGSDITPRTDPQSMYQGPSLPNTTRPIRNL